MAKILIADDEPTLVTALAEMLKNNRHEVIPATSAERAFELVKEQSPDLVLTDIEMPEGKPSGLDLLRQIKEFNRTIPVIMITGKHTEERELESVRLGAFDYIQKPFRLDEVLNRVSHALFQQKAVHALQENVALKKQLREKFRFENIVGTSPAMMAVKKLIERVADTESTVLIVGESGTGKELIAKELHYNSRRAAMPFVAVDCGALPDQLLESELFGHRKGAFTGAVFDRKGLFQEADGGTILLDEVSSMSLALQSKLLRALQEKEVRRVGDNLPVKVDVRVVAATNEALEKKIAKGAFREDLFYRLNVICIHAPPLREHREDIPLIVEHILKQLRATTGKPLRLTPEAMELFMTYSWPGNVRELENVLERGAVLTDNGSIKPSDLPSYLLDNLRDTAMAAAFGAPPPAPSAAAPPSLEPLVPLDDFVAKQERTYITSVLARFDGDKEMTAKALGISLATLYRKLKA